MDRSSALRQWVKKYWVELAMLAWLSLEMLFCLSPYETIATSCATPYLLSYRYGFAGRMLVGSVVQLFTETVTAKMLWWTVFVSLLVLNGAAALLCGAAVRRCQGQARIFAIGVIALYMLGPASPAYLYGVENFGRIDMYHLLLTLGMFALLRKKVGRFLIPLLCAVCMAMHQIFLFLLAPLVVMVLLYEMDREHYSRSSVALLLLTLGSICGCFLLFQLIGGRGMNLSYEELIAALSARTAMPIGGDMIKYVYYSDATENASFYMAGYAPFLKVVGGLSLALLAPIFVAFGVFWALCLRSSRDKKEKLYLWLCLLLPLATLPAFVMAVDWGRWVAGIFISQTMLIVYLLSVGERTVTAVGSELIRKAEAHLPGGWYWVLLIVLYLTLLGKLESDKCLRLGWLLSGRMQIDMMP